MSTFPDVCDISVLEETRKYGFLAGGDQEQEIGQR